MPLEASGKWTYRLRGILALCWASLYVAVRRLFRGPRLATWSWTFEMGVHFLRAQTQTAFDMLDPAAGREYEDAISVKSPAVAQVSIEPVGAPVRGHWYQPKSGARDVTVLYLHGGGYAYYAKAHRGIIALVTLAARSKTFALDYRLIPEHPFPAQLEDALAAYRWLLEQGVKPQRLVVMGDSAGGNLTLALLLSLRDAQAPLPALGICLAPWTDVENSGDSMTRNAPYDWIEKRMAVKWAEWFCRGADPRNPLMSPVHADLKGLPPVYIQAGGAEILHDMIRAFADRAQAQGADVLLEVWRDMNHDFQAFGDTIPESREALARIGQVVEKYVA